MLFLLWLIVDILTFYVLSAQILSHLKKCTEKIEIKSTYY